MGSYIREHLGAVTLSLLLHLAIVVALVFSINLGSARQVRAPVPSSVEVTVVSEDPVATLAAARERELERERLEQQRAEQARLEEQRIERERQQRETAAREAEERRIEQARLDLERQQREAAEREQQEAERRAEQQRLDEERRREEERIAEQRRLEEERRREEERIAEERRREEALREQEERERAVMEQQLQEALAAEQALMEAQRSGVFDRYLRQIQVAIEQAWIPPASASEGLECVVNVTQIPSGDVISVEIGRCNGDDAVRRSIEAAVLRASPLPTPSMPALFDRNLQVIFKPQF